MKQWTHKEFCKMLKKNGFYLDRYSGDHSIYLNDKGRHISVPHHLNACVALRLVKENKLDTNKKK